MSDRTAECRNSVSRRQFMRTAVVAGSGVLVAVGLTDRASAAPKKFSQQQAHYQPIPKNGQRCQNCALFQPANACQVVEGTVSPAGWCILYQPKS